MGIPDRNSVFWRTRKGIPRKYCLRDMAIQVVQDAVVHAQVTWVGRSSEGSRRWLSGLSSSLSLRICEDRSQVKHVGYSVAVDWSARLVTFRSSGEAVRFPIRGYVKVR